MSLVPLFHHGWPTLRTLGALVDLGKNVPDDEVIDRMIHHFREVDRLRQCGIGGPAMIRQLIVIGVLVGRAVFDVHGITKSRSSSIGPPVFKSTDDQAAVQMRDRDYVAIVEDIEAAAD